MGNVPNITQNFSRPSYRPDAQPGMDPDMRRMAIVAAGIGAAVALVIGGVSLSHHGRHGLPVVEAAPGPVRVKPLNPGGMQVAGAEDAAGGVEALAPAAEKPALHALHARSRQAASAHATQVAEAHPPAAPAMATHPAAPAVTSAPVQKVSVSAPVLAASPVRGTTVQLAAFETQQAAEQDWGKLAEKVPGLFNGHQPEVERAQVAGHTVYRLRTGGFANIAAATEFCGRVRTHGGDCTIAAF